MVGSDVALRATVDLEAACATATVGVMAVPSHGYRAVLERAAPAIRPEVPVVSLAGKSAVSRAGWSQLSNLGLPELVATSV